MAEVVQFRLERMLDEFDDLEQRGLFSKQEIAEIVKRRRKFEFRLKRPSPLKKDFLDYIDYEKQLDALRRLRDKSLIRKTGSEKSKKQICDYAGVARIINIYRLATTRFKGDLKLWFQYLEFCKERRHGRMKKALAEFVRFHPKEPAAWIYSAAWYFDTNLNVETARRVMLKGMRACPNSEDLWIEFIRMELTFLNKLRARKVLLGEHEGDQSLVDKSANEEQWKNENKELFMAFDKDGDSNKKAITQDGKHNNLWENSLSVVQATYSHAIEALPAAFSLRTRCLDIVEAVGLAHLEDMRAKILSDLRRDFSKEPSYWDWLARYEAGDLEQADPKRLGKAVLVYEEALEFIPSATMIELYVKFLMDTVNDGSRAGETAVHFDSDSHAVDMVLHLQTVYEKVENKGFLTEDLACLHVSFLLRRGKLNEAKMVTEKLCSGKFPNSVQLWTLRLSTEMDDSPCPTKGDLKRIFELFRNILMKARVSEAENLWVMGLKYFSNQRRYFDKLVEISVLALARDGGSESGFSLSSTVINYILQKDGVESARALYKRFLALPHPGLAIYRNCIELESNLAYSEDKTALANARKLYESALATYNQDASLWRDYHTMEVKLGSSETVAAVHWRARKALKDPSALLPHKKTSS